MRGCIALSQQLSSARRGRDVGSAGGCKCVARRAKHLPTLIPMLAKRTAQPFCGMERTKWRTCPPPQPERVVARACPEPRRQSQCRPLYFKSDAGDGRRRRHASATSASGVAAKGRLEEPTPCDKAAAERAAPKLQSRHEKAWKPRVAADEAATRLRLSCDEAGYLPPKSLRHKGGGPTLLPSALHKATARLRRGKAGAATKQRHDGGGTTPQPTALHCNKAVTMLRHNGASCDKASTRPSLVAALSQSGHSQIWASSAVATLSQPCRNSCGKDATRLRQSYRPDWGTEARCKRRRRRGCDNAA